MPAANCYLYHAFPQVEQVTVGIRTCLYTFSSLMVYIQDLYSLLSILYLNRDDDVISLQTFLYKLIKFNWKSGPGLDKDRREDDNIQLRQQLRKEG